MGSLAAASITEWRGPSCSSESLLNAHSPFVFASDQEIPIDEAAAFTHSILEGAYSNHLDAVDAMFEAIKNRGPGG